MTNDRRIIKLTLQSLPIALAAIAFCIYALTFRPHSIENMATNGALIEYVSYYEICSNGKPVVWFKTLGDSLLPDEMSIAADSTVTNKRLIEGVFVNRYAFVPSCRGRILTTFPDSLAFKRLASANKNVASMLQTAADRTAEDIKRMEKEAEETDYYLRIHNVRDDGYNTIAEFSAQLKERKEKAEALLSTLKSTAKKGRLGVRMIRKYTLLYCDTVGMVRRIACNELISASGKPFVMLQTANKRMPDGATAVYLHRWLTPRVEAKDGVIVASHPTAMSGDTTPTAISAKTFGGVMADGMRPDLPPTLTPNGAVVYTERGFFIGVCLEGRIVKPCDIIIE